MPLISVIIPVYNAEKYLNNTINSVINQTICFENIELILVDDASTDNSRKIIQKYDEKYENIKAYFCKKNNGFPGKVRNIGLKETTTKFICFLDADDEYDKYFCKRLYDAINEENVDLVCCDKITVDNISEIKNNIDYTGGYEINDKIIIKGEDILLFKNISVWNKIYKKEILEKNNINFPDDIKIGEDYIFNIEYFLKSKKIVYLKGYYGYKWNVKHDSISHTITKNNILKIINTDKIILNILKKENKNQLASEIFKENILFLLTQCTYLNINTDELKLILKEIYKFEKEINFTSKLKDSWANITNYFLLHQQFSIVIIWLKFIAKLRGITFLRKINR